MPNDNYRDIYRKEIVDHKTGEVVESETLSKKRIKGETFFFVRITDQMPWITQFNTLLELQLLMYMMLFEDPKSGKVVFSAEEKLKSSELFKVKIEAIENTISKLKKLGHIRRISSGLIKVNPSVFYNGGSNIFTAKTKEWKGDSNEK